MWYRFRTYRARFPLLQSLSPAAHLGWVVGCALLLCAAHASAGQVNLSWDAVTAPNLEGYRLYYGQTPGTYTTHLDVGLQTTATVTGLTAGRTYYFVVTACDAAGNESDDSNMVSVTISSDTPPPGDLDGDGKADLVWRHSQTGLVAVWLMHGTKLRQSRAVARPPDSGWQIVRVSDVDGDGKADLVWHHNQTTLVAVWLMHGTKLRQARAVARPPDSGWQIQ